MGWELLTLQPWWAALAGLALLQMLWGYALARRLRRLERRLDAVLAAGGEVAAAGDPALRARIARVEGQLEACLGRLDGAISRVGVVRFNAFTDVGGEQSYAVALLNDRGDGIVLSSLFGREQSWTYAKPVRGGSSPYPLSREEQRAIARALGAAGDE